MRDLDLRRALARPLITGASVSADYSSFSPGKKLALRYDPHVDLRLIARGGTPGAETIKRLSKASVADRSAVIAVDFFFWDATRANPAESLRALDELLALTGAHDLPLVLGDIPELLPGRQPSRLKLNEALRKAADSSPRVGIMPFEALLERILSEGTLEIKGRRYHLLELVPDGLHLAQVAGDFLADLLEEVLSPLPKASAAPAELSAGP